MTQRFTQAQWHAVAGRIEVEEDDIPDIASFYPEDFGHTNPRLTPRPHEEIIANTALAADAPWMLHLLREAHKASAKAQLLDTDVMQSIRHVLDRHGKPS